MISLEEISKLGIGTYRMSTRNPEHFKALEYAIDNNINLIDTASNYSEGLSEELIGNLFQKRKDLTNKAFIITKAGYIGNYNIEIFDSLISKSHLNYLKTGNDSCYSIDPKFLFSQIQTSLKRLNRNYIDCFMLHSVERYFLDSKKKHKLYDDLVSAIEFLNTLVQKKIIRYLGISSNTFALPEKENFVDLQKIINLLKEKNIETNLKFIQFPYNLNEIDASQKKFKSKSLFEVIKENKMISVTNRPLNTKYQDSVVRLVTFNEEVENLNLKKEYLLFKKFIDVLQIQLNKIDKLKPNIKSFTPIKFLIENRKKIASPETLNTALHKHLIPFLNVLYEDKIDQSLLDILNELCKYWKAFSEKMLSDNALKLRNDLITKKIISKNNASSLTDIALDNYLNKSNINHVLIGMRNIKYIKQLKKFNET